MTRDTRWNDGCHSGKCDGLGPTVYTIFDPFQSLQCILFAKQSRWNGVFIVLEEWWRIHSPLIESHKITKQLLIIIIIIIATIITMKITLSKKYLCSLFHTHDEHFCLKETRNAIQVVLQRLKRNGCNVDQAQRYHDYGDYNAALKELSILYDHHDFTKNEMLVDFLYQAWESFGEYRHHRTKRANKRGVGVEQQALKKQECDRGRLQVWRWRHELFLKNSPSYSPKALELLYKAPLFRDLADGHVLPSLLAPHMQRRFLPKDRLLWKILSDPEGVYFLESGEVEITGSLVNDEDETILPGKYFGAGPPCIGMRHSSYCRATKDCTMYLIETDTFNSIIEQFQGVKHRLVIDSVKEIMGSKSRLDLDIREERKRERNAQNGIVCTDFKTDP